MKSVVGSTCAQQRYDIIDESFLNDGFYIRGFCVLSMSFSILAINMLAKATVVFVPMDSSFMSPSFVEGLNPI